ncbi:MAG: hypothetical protein ACKV22_07315 [Bryobacteraceae bacterium]
METRLGRFLPAFFLLLGSSLAQVADFTGNWHLNVQRSTWGKMNRPSSVVLRIDHREPALHYNGAVRYTNEDTRDFAFDGAINGKPYPMMRSYGEGSIVIRRVSPTAFESVFRTPGDSYVETTRTEISKDGKTLTRALHLLSPEGIRRWTEVYERK